jgi:DHA3 family macrolide efflux protein-like MFS transporter
MILSHAVMALCTLALGLAPSFWLYLVAMGVLGISLPFFNTPSTVMIQEHVEEAYLGRVFSVMTMIFTSLMPLGMLLFGPLAEVVRIEWLLVVSGIILIALLPLVLMNKRLLEAGRKSESVSPSANPARSL